MSQVGITPRPPTQAGMGSRTGINLPQIQHPLSRMCSPDKLDIRGMSRAGDRPVTRASVSGRPLAHEGSYPSPRKIVSSHGRVPKEPMTSSVPQYEVIPEGVEVQLGDPSKTKIPIFGSRTGLASRGDLTSRAQSRLSASGRQSAQARLEIDEFEMLLRDKAKNAFYELRKKFKDNDPEGQGNVSREALGRIIVTLIGRPLNGGQFYRLMDRIGLQDKQIISFPEFHACFRDISSSEYPRWMDPVHRHFQDKVTMNASQVHAQLKERAKQRFMDLADLIPQSNPGGAGKLVRAEFKNALNKMMYFMDDEEFEKLWFKYDPDNRGTIDGQRLLNKLGINIRQTAKGSTSPRLSPIAEKGKSKTPRKKEVERKQSLDIEKWLKGKFREGCITMRQSFEKFDANKTGMVSHDEFLDVLADYGLPLEKGLLDTLLARCQVEIKREGVPYHEFLHRFQDRSEAGMAHNILTNPKHQYNREASPGEKSTLSALESQLMNMFQRDFLALLGSFHKIDRHGTDLLSQEEFRAAIESRFNLELTGSQFRNLIDRAPLNEDGMVKYADFMAQFDTRGKAPSLFHAAKEPDRPQVIVRQPERRHGSPIIDPVIDRLVIEDPLPVEDEQQRTPHELFRTIKDLLNRDFQAVETAFHEIDDQNSMNMTQEMFYQLMKRFDVQPEITRGDVRELWKTFIINKNKSLNYHEFVRHFGYSARSAAFPNAKISPPKKGDNDFMIRSRKLNCAADMLQDNLRAKIDYMWEDLRREFVDMDPYGTGFVSVEEFREVLSELCIHLSEFELDMLTKKFDIKNDKRVSYVEFLKPFALRKAVWRHGNNMLSLLQHPQSELPIADTVEPPQKGLTGITAKLRQKLSGEWKNLRRAFKKLDVNNEGYLSLPEFRSVLKLANVMLDEDEVYHVMAQFDENVSGKISYKRFMSETFKPTSRSSVYRSI